jgi:hypothetical protein
MDFLSSFGAGTSSLFAVSSPYQVRGLLTSSLVTVIGHLGRTLLFPGGWLFHLPFLVVTSFAPFSNPLFSCSEPVRRKGKGGRIKDV